MVLAAQPGSGGDQRMMEYYAMDKGIKAAVALVVAGMAVAASAQEVVKIGTMSPLSGPQAHYGKDNVAGVRFAGFRFGNLNTPGDLAAAGIESPSAR